MKITAEVTPEMVQEMADCIDECDLAFSVLNTCHGLEPRARDALREAWHTVQRARAKFRPGISHRRQAIVK